jgi:hypothetical protein
MLAGVVEGDDARVTRFIAPDQRTGGVAGGWVEVTQNGKMVLALALRAEERYLARIHSHPGAAFHSWTDDRNPGLTAEGSFSLVVPYFGLGLRRGIQACAVYRLRRERWVELSPQELEREVRSCRNCRTVVARRTRTSSAASTRLSCISGVTGRHRRCCCPWPTSARA